MAKYLSGRSKRTPQSGLRNDRYRYLGVNQTEPNLGDPVLPGPVLPVGQQYQSVSIIGYPGERYWVPISGGLIPGSISIYDEGLITPPGGVSSITQLNFVGAAITAKGYLNPDGSPGVGVTITVFSPGTQGQVIFNNNNDFKGASGLFYDNSTNYVGIGTSLPTQELDLTGDLRLRGTIYDYNNQPGNNAEILVKNNFGGLTWVNQNTLRAGAGGTITNIQYHNNVGLVDGAPNFVFDYINNRVGIGSTLPTYLFDVLGYSRFKGQTEIDYLRVTGVTTLGFATITNSYLGVTTIGYGNIINSNLGITTVGLITATNAYIGVATLGFATITNSYIGVTTVGFITAKTGFVGILTVTEINIDRTNLINLNVTGIATIATLGVTGLTTTRNLNVIGITTTNILNVAGLTTTRNLNVIGIATFDNQVDTNNIKVTGVGTFGNVKISGGTVATDSGNLTLDSLAGTTQINDALYVNDATESNDKNTGSIVTEGGVGIEKNLNVGGKLSVTGIVTTITDLYVGGDLYVKSDIYYDNLNGRRGEFTEALKTKDFETTGISTIKTLGVTGLTTTRNLKVIGISTFDDYIDANGGAYIDNIQIGISGDNEIDTTTGNLTIDSAGGTTTIDDNLTVSGASTLNGNVIFGDATTDTVSFTSRVGTGITPSTNALSSTDANGKDLGGNLNNWRKVYAKEFVGAITGNADTATKLQTPRSIAATNDITWSVVFDGSTNVSSGATLADSGVTAGTYGSSTQVGIVTVDSKGRITSASNIPIAFSSATVDKANQLTNARNFSITGDVDAPSVSFNGTGDVNLVTTLDNTGVVAGTYGSSTQVGIVTVDSKGRITSASNTGINFSTATVANADKLTNPRNIAITGDLAWNVNFDGSANVTAVGTLANSGVVANTYGSSTQVPVFAVDAKGRITSVTNTGINFSTATVAQADRLTNSRNFSITGDVDAPSVSFNGTGDVNLVTTLDNTGVVANTYGSSTTIPVFAVDAKGRITSVTNTGINFSTATVAQADKLTNPRNIAITGDLAWNVNFDGSANVTATGTLANSGVVANTYGSSTTIPVFAVDAKGRITSVTNTGINFSAATVAQADSIKTTSSTLTTLYPTFVANNNISPASAYESVYTDSGITYNATTDLLSLSKIKPTQIQDSSGGTGTQNYVLTADGAGGGWSWKSVTGSGSQAIPGITIQEEGTTVGTALGTQILNFTGGSVTATSPTAGTANISISATADIFVNQTGYGCVNPITITGGNTINIGSVSNAYGRKFISATDPTLSETICNGDIWYDTSGSGGSSYLDGVGAANQVVYKNSSNILSGSVNLQFNGTDLYVGGDIYAFYTSDRRLKNNIAPIPNALNKVLSISGNTFDWDKKSGKIGTEAGVIAQEILEVLPEAVTTRDNGYLAVRYEQLVPLLIEAIKDLKTEMVELKEQISELKLK
jgi:hypothetical protein